MLRTVLPKALTIGWEEQLLRRRAKEAASSRLRNSPWEALLCDGHCFSEFLMFVVKTFDQKSAAGETQGVKTRNICADSFFSFWRLLAQWALSPIYFGRLHFVWCSARPSMVVASCSKSSIISSSRSSFVSPTARVERVNLWDWRKPLSQKTNVSVQGGEEASFWLVRLGKRFLRRINWKTRSVHIVSKHNF